MHRPYSDKIGNRRAYSVSPKGAGTAMSPGRKIRALTASIARIKIKKINNGAMYERKKTI
jgi:hypothetical protein